MPNIKIDRASLKYKYYVTEHPECRLMTREQIISVMMKEKYLTKSEAEFLQQQQKPQLPHYDFKDSKIDYENIFDLQLSGVESKSVNYIQKPPVFHKTFKDLIVKDNGQIDMNQFDIKFLKQRFTSDLYYVQVASAATQLVNILDRTTNQPVMTFSFDNKKPNSLYCCFRSENGSTRNYVIENGKVSHMVTVSNNHNKTVFYNDNGQIEEVSVTNLITKKCKRTKYENGYPYIEISGEDNVKNILAEDLHKDICAKNKYGVPTTRASIQTNVLKRINKDNVFRVLSEYKKQYNSDLIKDIKNEIGLKSEVRDKLVNHIINLIKTSDNKSTEAGRYIAELLADDIYGPGSGNLKEDIYLINKDNVGVVAKEYHEITKEKHAESEEKHKPVHIPLTELSINPANIYAPIEGLLKAIDNEWGLDEGEIEKYTKHIIDCAKESGYIKEDETFYTEDIKQDIASHPNDKDKLDIDIMRLGNRRNISRDKDFIKPNGKIDSSFRQGDMGDCWLIAGLISIIEEPGGKDYLESLLEYDDKTGDVTVNLKGANKKYRITSREIAEFNQLAGGDGDIRAIEIAMDKYLKEQAYKNPNLACDIHGNHAHTVYKALLGNGELISYGKAAKNGFHRLGYVYTLGNLKTNNNTIKAETVDGNDKVTLLEDHGYAIVKEDKYYLYLKNPHNFTNFSKEELEEAKNEEAEDKREPVIIKISKNDLAKMNPSICFAKLKS